MSWTSPLTALSHLSDEAVAAFADGVLSDTARQRAQSHMAGCAECSDAVYGQRAARAALRSALRPSLPAGLFERLRELPVTAELPATHCTLALSDDGRPLFATSTVAEPGRAVASGRPVGGKAGTRADPSVAHRRASTRVGLGATAAAVLAAGVLATTAASAGGVTPTTRTVQPATGGHDAGANPISDPAAPPIQMTLLSGPSTGR